MYNAGEREKKIKTTFGPISYSLNIHKRPHLSQISGGFGPPFPPPFWIRAWYGESFETGVGLISFKTVVTNGVGLWPLASLFQLETRGR